MSALKIKNSLGEWQEVPMIKGDKGDTYELTTADMREISDMVKNRDRILPLNGSDIETGNIVLAIGAPAYVDDVNQYAEYGITETGWYVFARILAKEGGFVSVEGAAGYVAETGGDHVDVAVRFEVAATSQIVDVDWSEYTERIVFQATDLAIRNLDYRVTFYVYDADDFATWEYAPTADATFAEGTNYYVKEGDDFELSEVTAGDPVPTGYYELSDDEYVLTSDTTFVSGKTYYVKTDGTTYTAAEVTAGDPVPTVYYTHSKVTIEGLVRNVTYRLNETVDCPMEFILPEIEDDCHGAWFEIRCRHAGAYSMTLVPPEGVKIATEHTQKETAGINMINLHYTVVDGVKVWRFMNTHSSIPSE